MPLPESTSMKSVKGTIQVPTVGFGTWAPGDTSWCYDAVLQALKSGYRHVDAAWNYGIDDAVGHAIRDSGVPRHELFITSKFWPQFGAPENVAVCLDLVLSQMGLNYLDLFLAHWPVTFQANAKIAAAKAFPGATPTERGEVVDTATGRPIIDWVHTCASVAAAAGEQGSYADTWRALQQLVGTGKVRAVGVSNFSVAQLREVLAVGGEVPVSCNQIEAHPLLANNELIDFMRSENILAAVYSPFAPKKTGQSLVQDPVVKRLAAKNDMGEGQLLQSWAVQRGTVPLGKSQTPDRIKANLKVQELSEEDMHELSNMNQGEAGRTVDLSSEWGVKLF